MEKQTAVDAKTNITFHMKIMQEVIAAGKPHYKRIITSKYTSFQENECFAKKNQFQKGNSFSWCFRSLFARGRETMKIIFRLSSRNDVMGQEKVGAEWGAGVLVESDGASGIAGSTSVVCASPSSSSPSPSPTASGGRIVPATTARTG